MAMTGDDLATAVMAALGTESKISALSAAQKAEVKAGIAALCAAIVSYVQANAVVTIDSMTATVLVQGALVPVKVAAGSTNFGIGSIA